MQENCLGSNEENVKKECYNLRAFRDWKTDQVEIGKDRGIEEEQQLERW